MGWYGCGREADENIVDFTRPLTTLHPLLSSELRDQSSVTNTLCLVLPVTLLE